MIWATIVKFLLGNWKVFVTAGAALFIYFKFNSLVGDFQEFRSQKEKTIVQLVQERDAARAEAASAQSAMWEMKANEKRLELLLEDAIAERAKIRAEASKQIEVFQEHNFEALTKAKPGLIEKLANKATKERMDAFEDAFNN